MSRQEFESNSVAAVRHEVTHLHNVRPRSTLRTTCYHILLLPQTC